MSCCSLKLKQLVPVLAALLLLLGYATASTLLRVKTVEKRNCAGDVRSISLKKGQEIVLETPGFNNDFIDECKESWSVTLHRDNQEFGQWRIRVDVQELNLPCSSTDLRILEDGNRRQNIQYCEKQNEDHHSHVFLSHEHVVDIEFRNKNCKEDEGECFGLGAKLKLSAEYVCGGTFEEEGLPIGSPFYPNNYPDSTTCIYDIRAGMGQRIELTCPQFQLSQQCDSQRCGQGEKDYIMDLGTLQRYTGTELEGGSLVSRNNHLTLYFISNPVILSEEDGPFGFNCSFRFF